MAIGYLNQVRRAKLEVNSVIELFEEQAANTPNKIALHFREQAITYKELNEKANAIASNILLTQQYQPAEEHITAIYLEKGLDLVFATLGALKVNSAFVLIDSSFHDQRIYNYLEQCKPSVLISSSRMTLTKRFLSCHVEQIIVIDKLGEANCQNSIMRVRKPENLCYVVFTSGTTGKPKGIMIENRSLVNVLLDFYHKLDVTPDDILLSVTSPSFDIFLLELFLPLISGATCILYDKGDLYDANALKSAMLRIEPTLMQATPSLWRLLAAEGLPNLPKMTALCGGEKLDNKLATALISAFKKTYNVYGPSETTIWSSCIEVTLEQPITLGVPISHTDYFVLNANLAPLNEVGNEGELYIAGKGLARGYLNDLELTATNFIEHPFIKKRLYKTGDLVKILPSGQLQFKGRMDYQVKINGHRVELEGIEKIILDLAVVNEACVIVGPEATKLLVFYVSQEINQEQAQYQMREAIHTLLPKEISLVFVKIDTLPLNSNGKIARNRLLTQFEDQQQDKITGDALVDMISKIWKDVLAIGDFSLDDSFIMLGGNSIHVPQIISKLNKLLNQRLTMRSFIENQTVNKLAQFIGNTMTMR